MSGLEKFSSEIKKVYDSDSDDISSTINLLLSEACRYNRIGSYFSSKSFVSLAEGLSEFISKGGKMRLIINYALEEEDYDAIKKAVDPNKIKARIVIDIRNLKSEIELNSAKVLGWLIANGRLEIRLVLGDRGRLMHIKQGVIEDQFGNKVAFNGSANETYSAYERNIEQITFFKSWESDQDEYVNEFLQSFEAFWADKGHEARTYEIAKAIEEELVKIRPKNKKELTNACFFVRGHSLRKSEHKKITPRPYQDEAKDNWIRNGKRGIIEMPTGCGKTKTAFFCYQEAKKNLPLITVIFAPTLTICNQWLDEFKGEAQKICKIFDNSKWKVDLKKDLIDVRLGVKTDLVVIGTYSLINSDFLINQLQLCDVKKLLIADEVHSTGAYKTSEGLIEAYDFRLGLSATPRRWLDDEGTQYVFDYFGDVVFDKIKLFDAIYGLQALSEYNYHLTHVTLNGDELDEYEELTQKISRKAAIAKKGPHDSSIESQLQRLLEKRAQIIKNCAAKLYELEKIIETVKEDRTILFVSPQQRESVNDLLLNKVRYCQFTYSEPEKERKEILNNFKTGKITCIVAIKCLDEGLDVPAAKVGVILSSSGNPREFIQRRGRLLRKDPSKECAEIYDFFVTPPKNAIMASDLYKTQINNELRRIQEFAEPAKNEIEVTKRLKRIITKLGI